MKEYNTFKAHMNGYFDRIQIETHCYGEDINIVTELNVALNKCLDNYWCYISAMLSSETEHCN